jgi:hypothetical protein
MGGKGDASAETGDFMDQSRPRPYENYKNGNSGMQLSWFKVADDWCLLGQVDSIPVGDHGVFVIWQNGDLAHESAVLYVGRGPLAQEIARCRRDLLSHSPELNITWAVVHDVRLIDGIAAYLYQRLRPMWGEVITWGQPQSVNLPVA